LRLDVLDGREDRVEGDAGQGLVLEQRFGGLVHRVPVGAQHVECPRLRLLDDPLRLLIDDVEGVGADGAEVLQRGAEEHLAAGLADRHRPERRAHAVAGDHLAGEFGRRVEVVAGAGRALAELLRLGGGAGKDRDQLSLEGGLPVHHRVAVGQHVGGGAELAAAGDDRELLGADHLADRPGRDGVAGLVDRDRPALLLTQQVFLRRTGDDPVDRLLERLLVDLGAPFAHRQERRLVDQVRQLGAGEAGAELGDLGEVDIGRELAPFRVQLEDFEAAVDVRDVDDDLAVEAARAQQGGVEDVGAVGGAHHHQPGVAAEAVHLHQQLVQRLLALVVALPDPRAALAPGGVELVDEDDRRGHLAGLREEVADAGRADADQRLDELGARGAEEGSLGLAGGGPREQRLAGPRRTDKEHALRRCGAHREVFVRVLEEVADLLQLGQCFSGARDRVEGDRRLLALLAPFPFAAEGREGADAACLCPRRLAHEK
jgi:hypothetical protein